MIQRRRVVGGMTRRRTGRVKCVQDAIFKRRINKQIKKIIFLVNYGFFPWIITITDNNSANFQLFRKYVYR